MSKHINECLDDVPTEEGCLIITGREGMFSAGFDLKTIQGGDMKLIQNMTINGFKLLSRIFAFPRPVIAACSGHGIALGTFLLCCCDYRIGVKGEFMLGANEMRTNMVIPLPILELIKFRVAQSHKYRDPTPRVTNKRFLMCLRIFLIMIKFPFKKIILCQKN